MWLLLAFLAVPLIEIALFIQVGGAIGLGPTLGIVVLTAVAGTYLVRSQGSQVLLRLRRSFETLEDPSTPLADGAMILFAGALLLTPGFFTDTLGFFLLVPAGRALVRRFIASRFKIQNVSSRRSDPVHRGGVVIEGDYEEVRPDAGGSAGHPSGWTRP